MSDELLSPLHRKLLKRLVGKYGSGLIAREAMKIRATPRSGPPRTNMWDDVQWIEERADELGRGYGAVKRATTERFMMVTPHSKHTAVALSSIYKAHQERARPVVENGAPASRCPDANSSPLLSGTPAYNSRRNCGPRPR